MMNYKANSFMISFIGYYTYMPFKDNNISTLPCIYFFISVVKLIAL